VHSGKNLMRNPTQRAASLLETCLPCIRRKPIVLRMRQTLWRSSHRNLCYAT